MPGDAEESQLRLLAPTALVVCAIAFFAVIAVSGGGGDGGGERAGRTAATDRRQPRTPPRRQASAATYTVKTGDTLGEIAQKTGVSVQQLQDLNPQLDPQALVSGQKIKLRE